MNALLPRASRRPLVSLFVIVSALLISQSVSAQDNLSAKGKELYDQIKTFALTGGSAEVKALVLKRDRVSLTFDGAFYFTASIAGHVTGAVFIGQGRFSAEVPPSQFEKDNLRRLLGTDVLESDFKTAVLRFSDDTFDYIGTGRKEGVEGIDRAQKLATEMEIRILKETGANLSARIALSILNAEKPGFFFATFDGGKRNRFSFLIDHQNRLPVAHFGINGGEKGLIFAHKSVESFNEVWLAFYSLEDYQRGQVRYSDVNDLVDITKYDMDVDLRNKKRLGLKARITMQLIAPSLRALSFKIGEFLSDDGDERLKKQMRLKSVRSGSVDLAAVQEDWEGGFTVFLPEALPAGQQLELVVALDGEFLHENLAGSCHYPLSNESWFPRHGDQDRAVFDLTFRNQKDHRIACGGVRLSEEPDPEDKNTLITKYRMEYPVTVITFALGPWERHKDLIKWEKGGEPTPLEFSSLPGSDAVIKEAFIMAELSNAVRYFSVMFGKYPYPVFGGAYHPFGFGQGFPTLLMIPAADRANKNTYVFIAHETAHQWWGGVVAWRSYRDQWLSEGFAEYSGILYTGVRDGAKARDELLSRLRDSLKLPPQTTDGLGKGKLIDVGPIVLGQRLRTTKTADAYTTLIYNKGALVLRMLHFLLSDPDTGSDKEFFAMMTDFVERYHGRFASTDDFRAVANEHFARTAIAQQYGLKDLNWFFRQWVYETGYPTFELEYQMQDEPGGKVLLSGTVTQTNVPDGWFNVLPVLFTFGEKQEGLATLNAYGPKTPFKLRLPMRPKKIELDPHHWIISEKTSTKGG